MSYSPEFDFGRGAELVGECVEKMDEELRPRISYAKKEIRKHMDSTNIY